MKILIISFFLLLTSVFLFLKDYDVSDELIVEETKKEVVVKKLVKKNFEIKRKFSGFTEASRIVILKSQVEGKISSKFFDKGKAYKAGTQLILIDPEDKIAKLKEMEALLNQRKKEYEVAENLFKKGFRSEVKLSESRTNFEKALALYENSQVKLNNTKIFVPFDSIVEESYVELGDYLKKGDPIAKVVDLDPIFISINVTEKEIDKIKKGEKASVKILDSFYEGEVNYVSRTADKLTRNFKVQIKLSNPNNKIISGLSSEIEIGTKNDSAFFIASSLISLDSQGILGIKIILNDKVSFLPIEVLSDVGTGYWIKLKKLVAQDILIITQGSEYVTDGDLISFKFEEDAQ
jgi:multidrug efflux system membrane fusion protein